MSTSEYAALVEADGAKFIFFGGKGGVGKTTLATLTAVWFADHGHRTVIVSTDPTVSLSAVFRQEIGGVSPVQIREVKNLCGLNINPGDAKGAFQRRFTSTMAQVTGAMGDEVLSTPCVEEMATFDQFVGFLEDRESDVVVFDTAPTGKTLRELALPFDWAGFLQKQILQGRELARVLDASGDSFEGLERDRDRYERAMMVLRDPRVSVFSLVLLPERLPIEETDSAIRGLKKLEIPVQALVVNQVIPRQAVDGNAFLAARARLQSRYLEEIDGRFASLVRKRLPLLEDDPSDVAGLRKLGAILYGDGAALGATG